jgi:regulator of extracellular matrix RemA (YlzA/DUF370 family)
MLTIHKHKIRIHIVSFSPATCHYSTAFDGEMEAIRTALRLLNLHQNRFERAVVFSDSMGAILSAGSTETVISTRSQRLLGANTTT